MELIELSAKSRENKGKGAARKLRKNNEIPAIVYGAKKDPAMLSIDNTEFIKIIREHGSMGLFFNLNIDGDSGKKKSVMLKDIQMDTFSLNYLHIDLHEIDMDTEVTMSVLVETIGESIGVKEGGLLQIIRRELDVVCKPTDAPETIQIDISDLDVGDAVHVEDIDLGENIEIPHDVNFTIITIGAPTVEEEEIEEEDELLEEGEEAAAPLDEETPEE
ncbi:MAG: 50S ribosomal protein L25/general stress protein Ctc [Desulfobacula sp.]|uniref:50S ribosomal protein L25/general stress protein Ctc n=1 Tax=Desulfobacula sp. TaxID=2593537 RepID=UPI001DCD0E2C|nr:50S ribosomal protein L25/general stress protein Ctc [Desulfobacula sp.]MBT3483798.1 50S ribosomal protein L25/general stress protein Ctc [Desulfobacula sp.]MBT3802986.1 50S ribosomal protein L25/general stress protein Ctc [Desulfobacula sp.]MBT4023501.1 50S ribosomal protein L25/general stress protein Ctc [Desulfobacula sp.]MBT4197034.1 50S ribosomal protein L25/general stress protein Ctc [Desulfobacula sp.]